VFLLFILVNAEPPGKNEKREGGEEVRDLSSRHPLLPVRSHLWTDLLNRIEEGLTPVELIATRRRDLIRLPTDSDHGPSFTRALSESFEVSVSSVFEVLPSDSSLNDLEEMRIRFRVRAILRPHNIS